MIKTRTLFIVAIVIWHTPPSIAGQVDSCTTLESFALTCSAGQKCCLSTTDYMVTYSCPLGYKLSGKTCEATTISGSDDTGYFTRKGSGSCDATPGDKIYCCYGSTSSGTACHTCANDAPVLRPDL